MELEYLNNILENVYEHGSDGQGGYNVNKEGVIEAMQKYIKFRR